MHALDQLVQGRLLLSYRHNRCFPDVITLVPDVITLVPDVIIFSLFPCFVIILFQMSSPSPCFPRCRHHHLGA
jgi:hypothetical protein